MRAVRCTDYESEHYSPYTVAGHQKDEPPARIWSYIHRFHPSAKDFNISLQDAFRKASKKIPSISVKRGVLGGSPCIDGTRIPVYMILDAVEYYGTLEGVLRSYPHLTIDQVRDAVRFSKVAMECCIEH